MQSVAERTGDKSEFYKRFGENLAANLRVAMPGIIKSFDPVTQTVTVQPAIREKVRGASGKVSSLAIPDLLDVPVVFPRGGGFALTFPINPGDECLVVFADMCIDAWWSNGEVQNQIERRRHDLSDAFAIMGVCSQPRKLTGYSTNKVQLRSEDGGTRIEMGSDAINLVANSVTVNGHSIATNP